MKRALPFLVLGFALLLSWPFASGGDKKLAPGKKPTATDRAWSVDDVILAEEAGGMEIAPDGKHAVWVKRSPDKEKNEMIAHLMLTPLAPGGETIQLTRGQHSSHQPQWSPDGRSEERRVGKESRTGRWSW